jgi:hypothetical protein
MIGNIVAGTLSLGEIVFVNPASISNLYLWLDADDASTFTYSSGTVVSQWNDKSANGYNATQATVANQPSRVTSPSTGVKFDGSNDVLSTTASFNGSIFTIFSVIRDLNSPSTLIGTGEIVAYNKVLTATELSDVRGYLSTKWGITAAGEQLRDQIDTWYPDRRCDELPVMGGLVMLVIPPVNRIIIQTNGAGSLSEPLMLILAWIHPKGSQYIWLTRSENVRKPISVYLT